MSRTIIGHFLIFILFEGEATIRVNTILITMETWDSIIPVFPLTTGIMSFYEFPGRGKASL